MVGIIVGLVVAALFWDYADKAPQRAAQRTAAAYERAAGKLEGNARLLGSGEELPEFGAGQWVFHLYRWEWGRVGRCRRRGGLWQYEIEFDTGVATASGAELVP